jgi:hypothetical protein
MRKLFASSDPPAVIEYALARQRTDKGGVGTAGLVQHILQLAFADCLTEHREDGANRMRAMFGVQKG